jgi:hypothetical protein
LLLVVTDPDRFLGDPDGRTEENCARADPHFFSRAEEEEEEKRKATRTARARVKTNANRCHDCELFN